MSDRITGPYHPALIADTVAALRRDRKPAPSLLTITHTVADVPTVPVAGGPLDPLAAPKRRAALSGEADPEARTGHARARSVPLDREIARVYGRQRNSPIRSLLDLTGRNRP